MNDNILAIPWIWTTEGRLSPIDLLTRGHEIRGLDTERAGMEISATLRVLSPLFALTIRSLTKGQSDPDDLVPATRHLRKGIPLDAVNEACAQLEPGAHLLGGRFPFMQLKQAGKEPVEKSVAKLFPENPAEVAMRFWNLSSRAPERLAAADAIVALAIFHNFSPGGNSSLAGRKMLNGTPAFRYPGIGKTATEMVSTDKRSILNTLAMNVPKSWVWGTGLPAWADRPGEHSMQRDGLMHPMWQATWSSNIAMCRWDEDMELTAVEIGGIPDEWYHPTMGRSHEDRKAWWDMRNTQDPMYFYLPDKNKPDHLKAQRLDIGMPDTQLAIDWIEQGKAEHFQKRLSGDRIWQPQTPSPIMFLRHRIEGTATSPLIRASQVLVGNPEIWAPSESVRNEALKWVKFVLSLHSTVIQPFRRKHSKEPDTAVVLDGLESVKGDASTFFWRETTGVYERAMASIAESGSASASVVDEMISAAERAFRAAIDPYKTQYGMRAEYVESQIVRWLRGKKKMIILDKTPTDTVDAPAQKGAYEAV